MDNVFYRKLLPLLLGIYTNCGETRCHYVFQLDEKRIWSSGCLVNFKTNWEIQTIRVTPLPPRLSARSFVSLLSRYGMCPAFFLSPNEEIHFPAQRNTRKMDCNFTFYQLALHIYNWVLQIR